ncbi:MAG: alpha/beta hydrolase [Anaerolineales bacterium]|jgi:pimeloyl-ACP methyl ester carboxylesterase
MMPEIRVNNIELAYEVFGKGAPIVWTPGGRSPRDNWVYLLAGQLSANYKVLIWDRRNGSGASDIAFEEAPSDVHLWAADLHHLLHALDMSPAVVAGGSGGAVLALLMAQNYPEDVKGLILDEIPTDDLDIMGYLVDGQYFQLAGVAESEGAKIG